MNRLVFGKAVVVGLMLVLVLGGCSKKEDDNGGGGGAEPATSNHTIKITNYGTNTTQASARQFTYMTLTPVDLSSPEVGYTFVSNPDRTTISIGINIPKTGFYKLRIFLYKDGPSIWWNSIALQIDGTTDVSLSTNNMGFYDNSYAVGIHSDGNDIPLK